MKSITNKTVGNRFEDTLCNLLSDHGFWAHNLAQNQTGQPADVIAVRNNLPVIIDCKVCAKDRFLLSRIEPNQEAAMTLWEMQGNPHCYFALRLSDGMIYMIHFNHFVRWEASGKTVLHRDEIARFPTFKEWVEAKAWK